MSLASSDTCRFINPSGNQRELLGNLKGAFADYARAVELEPKNPMNWNDRGRMHKELGRLRRARADYAQAIRLRPKWFVPWVNRGVARRLLESKAHEKDGYVTIERADL